MAQRRNNKGQYISDKIIVRCSYCGKKKYVPRCRTKRQKNFYCNRECSNLDKKGKHFSLKTEFKKGIIQNKETVFKKGMKKQENAYSFPSGKSHPCWKGGITKIRTKIWYSSKYKEWRTSVFERDNYTCQICGKIGCKLEAHHIIPVSNFLNEGISYKDAMNIEEIFDINNGQTLCKECHRGIGHKNIKDKSIFSKKK